MTKLALIVFTLAVLTACSHAPRISPYKIDVQQGNVVTPDMVAKLQPGMTKSQVKFVLGTPLITDPFHQNRWDYVYRFEKAGKLKEHQKVAVVFENDILKRIEGDVKPSTTATTASLEAAGVAPMNNPNAAAPIASPNPSTPPAANPLPESAPGNVTNVPTP